MAAGAEVIAILGGCPGSPGLPVCTHVCHMPLKKLFHIEPSEPSTKDIDQGFYTLGTGKMYDDEVVIYPLRQKQLYIDPYIQMFYCLNKELESKKVWIVIGYSFRDPVIQNIFNINFKDGKKMILISPHPDEVKERFSDHREDIIAIKKYFGKDDSQNIINESIEEELSKLEP